MKLIKSARNLLTLLRHQQTVRESLQERFSESSSNPERAQAFTLEGFSAALILVASVVFALQVTAVTPLTASTSSQHIENQQSGVARGMLDSQVRNETLRPALLYWNETSGKFYHSNAEGSYALGGPPNLKFGKTLNRTFRDRGIAVNVNIRYITTSGTRRTVDMVQMGEPSDNGVTVRRLVTLYDSDVIYNKDGTKSSTTLEDSSEFYAPDASPNSPVYNVIVVEVITWRM